MPSCGNCSTGYIGTPCVANVNTSILRVTVVNSNDGNLVTPQLCHVDSFGGWNDQWAPTGSVLSVNTTTGQTVFSLVPSNYSVFGFPFSGPPLPSNGIGIQNVYFLVYNDYFITLYYVPRTLLSNTQNQQRVGVLTWQSSITGSETTPTAQRKVCLRYGCSRP